MIGATEILPSDRYPYAVWSSTKTTYTLKPLQDVSTKTGHEPKYFQGPFPVWDHVYTPEEIERFVLADAESVIVRKHKNGYYYSPQGIPFVIGTALYHRDFSE